MMVDLERKLLRIMYNFSVMHSQIPDMGELERKTGRSVKDITLALTELEQQRYLYWEDKTQLSGIIIFEDSDRDGVIPSSPPVVTNDLTYWTS